MGMATGVYVLANMIRYQKRNSLKVAVEVLKDVNHERAYPEAFMRGIVGVLCMRRKVPSSPLVKIP